MESGAMDCRMEKEDCYTVTEVSMMAIFRRGFLMEKVALSAPKAGIMKGTFARNKPKVMEHLCSKNVGIGMKVNGQVTILMGLGARYGQKEGR